MQMKFRSFERLLGSRNIISHSDLLHLHSGTRRLGALFGDVRQPASHQQAVIQGG
jgi:hypothetical protein